MALKNICSEMFMQIIINESVAELISSKISYFQHILLNTFRRIGRKHKHCSLRHISCWTFKQNSHFKILIVKSFDEITIKIKVASPIKKNENECFYLFLDQTCTLTLTLRARIFAYLIERASKIARSKNRAP